MPKPPDVDRGADTPRFDTDGGEPRVPQRGLGPRRLGFVGALLIALALISGGGPAPASGEESPAADPPPRVRPALRPRPAPRRQLPDSLASERGRLPALPLRFDFGSARRVAHGELASEAQARSWSYGWTAGMIRNQSREGADPALSDFVEGFDADFVVGVDTPDSLYRITLVLGDTELARGPVEVLDGDRPIGRSAPTTTGAHDSLTVALKAAGPRLTIRLRATGCVPFALCRMRIDGPARARLGRLMAPGPARDLAPPVDSLAPGDREAVRARLRHLCEFLLSQRPRDGGFSFTGAWYQNAFPVRALLAGGALLDEPAFIDSARVTLDRFAGAQLPTGDWYSTYFGPAECPQPVRADTMSSNLADVGTMALALAVGARDDASRGGRWRAALVRYADAVVLPAQLADGAFPNGQWRGRDYRDPYTVATATQASFLYALAGLTGDSRYDEAADRAAAWLAASVLPDGRVRFQSHRHRAAEPIESTAFGDLYYVMEALTWSARRSRAAATGRLAREALDRYLFGPAGLASTRRNDCWWPDVPGGAWGASKAGGMVAVLAETNAAAPRPQLEQWIENARRWIGTPDLAERIGIAADPLRPGGEFSLAATGFAGLGLAAALEPDRVIPVR